MAAAVDEGGREAQTVPSAVQPGSQNPHEGSCCFLPGTWSAYGKGKTVTQGAHEVFLSSTALLSSMAAHYRASVFSEPINSTHHQL